jgi:hypothetical protein
MTKRVALGFVVLALVAAVMFVPAANAAQPHAKWLYLLYLDADNSLDVNAGAHHVPVVESDFGELMSVGSTPDVIAYVLVDRYAGPTNLFRVEKGALVEQTAFALNGQEANMGDPATLRSFVAYTSAAARPDHTLLIFWDHGSPNYVAFDEHAGPAGGADRLSHQEVVQALDGYHIDVIAADECLVAQLEVAYEYVARGLQTDFLVAAETYTGWRGFPYDWTLQALVDHPDLSARETAMMVVQETQRLLSAAPHSGEEVNDHAAIDLARIPALGSSVLQLGNLLMSDMKANADLISKARAAGVYSYGANALNLIDLKTFALRIAAGTSSTEIRDAATLVAANVEAAVLAIQATKTTDHQVSGIGVALPNHEKEVPGYYAAFAFPTAGWWDFLAAYWAASGAV